MNTNIYIPFSSDTQYLQTDSGLIGVAYVLIHNSTSTIPRAYWFRYDTLIPVCTKYDEGQSKRDRSGKYTPFTDCSVYLGENCRILSLDDALLYELRQLAHAYRVYVIHMPSNRDGSNSLVIGGKLEPITVPNGERALRPSTRRNKQKHVLKPNKRKQRHSDGQF